MKTCAKCKQPKMLTEFHKNAAMPDGLHFYCKACHNASVAERRVAARTRLVEARGVAGFLEKVGKALEARDMKLKHLADTLGLKPDTVYAWSKGTKQPHPSTQRAVAELLGIALREEAFVQDSDGNYPDGIGECEVCGTVFPSYRKTFPRHCSRACASKAQSTRQFGEDNPAYKDGRKLTDGGYVQVLLGKGHPMAGRGGYALEHRYVMSQHLGRKLHRYEVVHHINGDKLDNRIENLELCVKDDARHPPGQRLKDVLKAVTEHPNIVSLAPDVRQLVLDALHEALNLKEPNT